VKLIANSGRSFCVFAAVSTGVQAARTVCHWCHCERVQTPVQPREGPLCSTICQEFRGYISQPSYILSTFWQSSYAVFCFIVPYLWIHGCCRKCFDTVSWHSWKQEDAWPVIIEWWGACMAICQGSASDLYMVQLMPLPPHYVFH